MILAFGKDQTYFSPFCHAAVVIHDYYKGALLLLHFIIRALYYNGGIIKQAESQKTDNLRHHFCHNHHTFLLAKSSNGELLKVCAPIAIAVCYQPNQCHCRCNIVCFRSLVRYQYHASIQQPACALLSPKGAIQNLRANLAKVYVDCLPCLLPFSLLQGNKEVSLGLLHYSKALIAFLGKSRHGRSVVNLIDFLPFHPDRARNYQKREFLQQQSGDGVVDSKNGSISAVLLLQDDQIRPKVVIIAAAFIVWRWSGQLISQLRGHYSQADVTLQKAM